VKSVLITGGTGALGQALTRRLLDAENGPGRIVIYSRGEHKQESMARLFGNGRLRYFIGDVRDKDRLSMAMRGCDTVIHAAALKVVPIAEYNPTECIKTNVQGAQNVCDAAIESGVKKALAISTDKACEPLNIYGATKLVAEKIFTGANTLSAGRTLFSSVRYGNVDGSTGSVMPLFKRLVQEGTPITVTHPDMTRFSISMDAAVDLILYAIENMRGREVFIPKLPSFKVTDLATALSPEPWKVSGIRAGEKIHETLISESESRCAVETEKHFILNREATSETSFKYTSGDNTEWLTVQQLRDICASL